jgi:hypothetical protein
LLLRLQLLRCQGVTIPAEWSRLRPREPGDLETPLQARAGRPAGLSA